MGRNSSAARPLGRISHLGGWGDIVIIIDPMRAIILAAGIGKRLVGEHSGPKGLLRSPRRALRLRASRPSSPPPRPRPPPPCLPPPPLPPPHLLCVSVLSVSI